MTMRRRFLGPAQLSFVVVSALAIAASVLAFPVEIRFPLVLGYLVVAPGYALVRQLKLDDSWQIVMLSLATSIGVASAISVVALYAGWWSPNGILIAVAIVTVLASYGELFSNSTLGKDSGSKQSAKDVA